MASAAHTVKGLKNLDLFHWKPVFYVEGKDDAVFWKEILSAFKLDNFHFKRIGDKPSLLSIAREIQNKNITSILIGIDRDYDFVCGVNISDEKILYTYGYSIENTMYCVRTLARAIYKTGRLDEVPLKSVESWKKRFDRNVYKFLIYDIANIYYKKGLKVMGDSSARFLTDRKPNLSADKINHYLDKIKKKITTRQYRNISKKISSYKKSINRFVRGHFYSNAINRLYKEIIIKKTDRTNMTITNDKIFSDCVDGCLICKQSSCDSYKYYKKHCLNAVAELKVVAI